MPAKSLISALLAFTLSASAANATNTPCSGKKGGVSHCMGKYFICNDGSTSQSKKNCSGNSGDEQSKADGTGGKN